ncbi:unnamed protein product [Schistocephalus solidus]|uniref:Secreted protein n=1 Tax=Schistocephalus solidus TaxID=70667 RepID=A0A183SU33_SCHSO|nr:unnamed protein product [Schistocephalus solidus]
MHFLVKFILCFVGAGHRGSVGTDAGGEFTTPKRLAEAYQPIIDALRQIGQTSTMSVRMAKVMPASRYSAWGPPFQKVKPAPTSSSWSCSKNRDSLSVAMFTLQRASFRATSAILRSGRLLLG